MTTSIFDTGNIPALTKRGLDAYVHERLPVGDFLFNVLSNNLVGAFAAADAENIRAMPAIVSYVHNHLPMSCWGSEMRVAAWISQRPEL